MKCCKFKVSRTALAHARAIAITLSQLILTADSAVAEGPPLADVPAAVEKLSVRAQPLAFSFPNVGSLTKGGHLQGVQMRLYPESKRHVAFISHDSQTSAYLVAVEFPADLAGAGKVLHVQTLPSDGKSPPLRHAGGFQLAGTLLAVGVEDNQQKLRAQVQFWDVALPSDPRQLEHLTIERLGVPKDQTAGAVAFIERPNDFLVGVANWDSRAIDFYTSTTKDLFNHKTRFEHRSRWIAAAADTKDWQPDGAFGAYQAINLIVDANDKLFLLGTDSPTSGGDALDLFAVDLDQAPARMLRKIMRKSFTLAVQRRFRFAGGVWVEGGRLGVLAGPRAFSAQTVLGLAR
jgi:hypothetical protein